MSSVTIIEINESQFNNMTMSLNVIFKMKNKNTTLLENFKNLL
jgi:hypothetical protein